MTIKEILTSCSKRDLDKAKKLVVRELDEEIKGGYVAYVDEGEDSRDVRINLKGKKVDTTFCDCEETNNVCIHKLAVLIALSGNTKKRAVKAVRSKKISEAEALLNQMDKEVIAQWLLAVFKKNKAFEQQFVLDFEERETTFTTASVQLMARGIIDSVAGKRKTLEGIKIKNMLDLLSIAHQPLNQYLLTIIDEVEAVHIFDTFLAEVREFDRRVKHYSKRTNTFVYDYSAWFALAILNIKSPEKRNQAMEQAFVYFCNASYVRYYDFRYFVILYLYQQGSLEDKKKIVTWIRDAKKEARNQNKGKRNLFLERLRNDGAEYNLASPVELFF